MGDTGPIGQTPPFRNPSPADVRPQATASATVGPIEMGRALIDALGLSGIPGIVKLQITCEAGDVPKLTVTRTITVEQAGAACLLLKEWNLRLEPDGPTTERAVSADGSVSEARTPPSPSLHPREG